MLVGDRRRGGFKVGRAMGIRRVGFALVHVWIVFHLVSVIAAPASVPPAAPLAQQVWTYCGGYLQMIFMNHGYHFFAPEPAGATLIAYEAYKADGTVVWNRIPNRQIWPRLNYHRHFMLTEHMAATIDSRPELEALLLKTYAGEIARSTKADRVVLYRVWHELSSTAQVRAGRRLDDPVTYYQDVVGDYSF